MRAWHGYKRPVPHIKARLYWVQYPDRNERSRVDCEMRSGKLERLGLRIMRMTRMSFFFVNVKVILFDNRIKVPGSAFDAERCHC